jgi:hypothetical protein
MSTKVERKSLTTEGQKELLRVLEDRFDEYDRRGQTNYRLNGMSTSHITLKCMQDFTTLKVFWPPELVQYRYGQTVYGLEDDTLNKVQSSIRSTLEKLMDKGWVERVGNEDERRWRLIRDKKETKIATDPDGNRIGTYVKNDDGKWELKLNK